MNGSVDVSNNNCLVCAQRSSDIRTGIKQVTWYGGLLSCILPGFPITTISAYAINQNAELIERNIFCRECTHQVDARCQEKGNLHTENDVTIDNAESTLAYQAQLPIKTVSGNNGETDRNLSANRFKFAGDENLTQIFT
ncbi:hypothetical protein [Endozoicomonas sp. YOMI1]|uniref:hypothetical protein n=1 Tax=Endozoicomonas sp. YOMI1 TaxID=2828739 RepID=UPI0021474D0F|nr:hypothetical protein [Endozoicomonas sp. YOMI1]